MIKTTLGKKNGNTQIAEDLVALLSDPKVMMGKPCITVELILDALAAGEMIEQILEEYPFLTREGIQAALSFAADALRADVVYPTAEEVVGENSP